jgi:hypothetical protein
MILVHQMHNDVFIFFSETQTVWKSDYQTLKNRKRNPNIPVKWTTGIYYY